MICAMRFLILINFTKYMCTCSKYSADEDAEKDADRNR